MKDESRGRDDGAEMKDGAQDSKQRQPSPTRLMRSLFLEH